jgi:hypothetical protein
MLIQSLDMILVGHITHIGEDHHDSKEDSLNTWNWPVERSRTPMKNADKTPDQIHP